MPHARARLGAVAITAITDARLGQMALRLLELGHKAPSVIDEPVRADPYAEYHQLGVIDADGCRDQRDEAIPYYNLRHRWMRVPSLTDWLAKERVG